MKNRHRPVPSFPAATSTIESINAVTELPSGGFVTTDIAEDPEFYAQAAKSTVDASEAIDMTVGTNQAIDASLGGSDDSAASLSAGRSNALGDHDAAEVHLSDESEAIMNATEPTYSRVRAADIYEQVTPNLDPVEVLRTPTPPTLKEFESAYVPAPPLDPLTAHINALLGEEEPSEDSDMERFEAELNIAAELKTFMGDSAVTLPDGSVRIPVIVPPEMVECIREWAHGACEPFDSYLQRMVEMGLNAVVLGGSVAG